MGLKEALYLQTDDQNRYEKSLAIFELPGF